MCVCGRNPLISVERSEHTSISFRFLCFVYTEWGANPRRPRGGLTRTCTVWSFFHEIFRLDDVLLKRVFGECLLKYTFLTVLGVRHTTSILLKVVLTLNVRLYRSVAVVLHVVYYSESQWTMVVTRAPSRPENNRQDANRTHERLRENYLVPDKSHVANEGPNPPTWIFQYLGAVRESGPPSSVSVCNSFSISSNV